MYATPQRREAASWKSWSSILTHEAAAEEAGRIAAELSALAARAGFPLEILPVAKVTAPEAAAEALGSGQDVAIVYAATGSGALLRACLAGGDKTIIFVRKRSGPLYYWYEALSVKYLRANAAAPGPEEPAVSVDDVVVDSQDELRWRLQAFFAARNFTGARVVALGGAGGKYAADAPAKARECHGLDIIEVGYDELAGRIRAAFEDRSRVARAEAWAAAYARLPGTKLETDQSFVVNAFLLYGIFKDILAERRASIFTINSCMGTILPMARTTACLTLSLLNDEGLVAFCESDFVIIPAGILLHFVARAPVFLHNSTFPHDGIVTCAHCTSPRRMDGARYAPARILTHYESEYGAAPKVAMPEGQALTFIDPEYATGRWVGMRGEVIDNPFYECCRSQQDVRIRGPWRRLLAEIRDSHWVMAYGDHVRAAGYAARRCGIAWDPIEDA
ncbi:MAG TPA: sugar isomerase [Planctomycetes bacterium]|nr:sugar isomerase [Planctomycetota bacterium]